MHRPTTMAQAFVNAAIKVAEKQKVNVNKGTGNWIARRVALSLDNKHNFVNDNYKKVK